MAKTFKKSLDIVFIDGGVSDFILHGEVDGRKEKLWLPQSLVLELAEQVNGRIEGNE